MFENVISFFKRVGKKDKLEEKSKDTAKERLHLVLMQDRANVSADFLDMMRQEIIEVIKKYIDVDEGDIDVRLTNKVNDDGTTGAPALYANIPIAGIKENLQNKETKKVEEDKIADKINIINENSTEDKKEEIIEEANEEIIVEEPEKDEEIKEESVEVEDKEEIAQEVEVEIQESSKESYERDSGEDETEEN